MKIFFLIMILFVSLIHANTQKKIFHKTVGKIEAYKEKETLYLRPGRVRRLTKNLLTPIHERKYFTKNKTEKHLITKNANGPLTIKFLLPISLKKEILALLSKGELTLSIPSIKNKVITSGNIDIDRYIIPPKGLFAMKSRIETNLLTPSEVVFIHLLKDDI